jgi:cyclopropane fatty-acyl-phospholipid synthase-like methyltransferase
VVSAFFNDSLFGQGIDYGFNFYNGDYSKSREKAQSDKFEFAIKQLNLEPGMWVIDIGCGCGDWLDYLHL